MRGRGRLRKIESGIAGQTLLQLANRDRAAHGLAPLKWSAALAAAAQLHAARMARQNTLSHQLPGEAGLAVRASQSGAHFSTIAENVAEGPSAEDIHRQWMNSPPHRANLLDPQLDSVGIAVENRNGTLFAVEDFSLAVGSLTLSEQEEIVGSQLRTRGLRLLDFTADARRSCLSITDMRGPTSRISCLHYATPDLETLPRFSEKNQNWKLPLRRGGRLCGPGIKGFPLIASLSCYTNKM